MKLLILSSLFFLGACATNGVKPKCGGSCDIKKEAVAKKDCKDKKACKIKKKDCKKKKDACKIRKEKCKKGACKVKK
ncbi:MAG: hypothetical protein ACRBBP_06545 [Bdellovibrionales bacterium]